MPRFFCPQPLSIGALVQLPDTVAHHLQVLRLRPGEPVTLFNGKGGEFVATLETLERRRASALVKTFTSHEAELPYAITLAQALPEGSKMDWIVEKAVELGVSCLQPLAAQRCVAKISGERIERKQAHWNGIVVAASEQCGRNRLMHLAEPADFNRWAGQQDLHRRLLLTPRAEHSLSSWARHQPAQAVTIVVGPEGGFTPAEEDAARHGGMIAVSMGSRVLRTETAGLTAISAVNAIWGEM